MGYIQYLRKTSVSGQPALICRPSGRHYGHCALEMLMAFTFSRLTGIRLYTLQPNPVINPALFKLEANGIDNVHCTGWRSLWFKLRWKLSEHEAFEVELFAKLAVEAHRYAQRKYLPASLVRRAKELSLWFDTRGHQTLFRDHSGKSRRNPYTDEFLQAKTAKLYLVRRNIDQPVDTCLPSDICADVVERLTQLGVQPGTPMVTVHARESGFHRGEEMQDANVKLLEGRRLDKRTDVVRNAKIDSYSKAIDFLVNEGYAVVRLGDPLMDPYRRTGVFDLATSPLRTSAMELYCLWQSKFVLCGESGPYSVSYLTNTPSVLVNATDPVSGYPIRKDRLYILKHVFDRLTGQPLRLNDMLTHRYLSKMRQLTSFQYVDNTPEDILEVVREMVAGLRDGWVATSKQRTYRERVTDIAMDLDRRERHGGLAYIRKWGTDRGFLGNGYIGAAWAARHLEADHG
jgi:putative glycosyltransferase (TIGR04372 family)